LGFSGQAVGGKAIAVGADISRALEVEQLFEKAKSALSRSGSRCQF
jgi:hypothetical protein